MSKKNFINQTHIEGYIYEHSLELKTSGPNSKNPGTEYISGNLKIATDEACINVITVHFSYTTALTSKGAPNATFNVLKSIIDGLVPIVITDGKENAKKVRIDSAIGLNEFPTNRDGKSEFVSAKRNEGGFVHFVDVLDEDEKNRNTFTCDILITGVSHIDAVEEKGIEEKVIVKGAIFDYKKSLLPVEFVAKNPKAMAYFEDLAPTQKEPVFTKVWGRQISETTQRKISEESAFGDDFIKYVPNTKKEFLIVGAQKEPYLWDDESTLTIQDLNEMITARETYLATLKQRNDEYEASKKSNANATIQAAANAFSISSSEFNF